MYEQRCGPVVAELGPAVASLPPCPLLAEALTGLNRAAASTGELLDAAAGWERLIGWATAGQAATLAEFARRRPPAEEVPGSRVGEFAADEVGAALHLCRGTAGARLSFALDLDRLPATAAALAAGRLGLGAAHRIADTVTALPDELAAAVEATVVPDAAGKTAGQVQAAAAKAVLTVDPAAAETRRQGALRERRVVMYTRPDGMASIWALLSAEEATRVLARLRCRATAARTPGDGRGHDERMADTFVDLLTGPAPTDRPDQPGGVEDGATGAAGRPPRGQGPDVQVVVAATTLLRLDEQPGHLAGYGPIPAELARQIAADPDATWRRILTDPASGTVTDVGRRTYRPPAALADHVRARDRTCRFPGCRLPAERCDLDHLVPYPRGSTCAKNLRTECRHHHRLKHDDDWHAEADPDDPGVTRWTDPTGHTYTTHAPRPLDPV